MPASAQFYMFNCKGKVSANFVLLNFFWQIQGFEGHSSHFVLTILKGYDSPFYGQYLQYCIF